MEEQKIDSLVEKVEALQLPESEVLDDVVIAKEEPEKAPKKETAKEAKIRAAIEKEAHVKMQQDNNALEYITSMMFSYCIKSLGDGQGAKDKLATENHEQIYDALGQCISLLPPLPSFTDDYESLADHELVTSQHMLFKFSMGRCKALTPAGNYWERFVFEKKTGKETVAVYKRVGHYIASISVHDATDEAIAESPFNGTKVSNPPVKKSVSTPIPGVPTTSPSPVASSADIQKMLASSTMTLPSFAVEGVTTESHAGLAMKKGFLSS